MSIASEITRLQNAKAAIKAAIEAKGVTVDDNATLDEYADLIEQIVSEDKVLEGLMNRTITNLSLHDGITLVPMYFFVDYSNLVSIEGSTITRIGSRAFQNCVNLTSISFPNLTVIEAISFANTGFTNIVLDKIVTINTQAFANCKHLISIDLPNTITGIANKCFEGCIVLESVIVRATTPPTLGSNVFDNNASGRKIYVPATSVNDYKAATNWSEYANDIEAIPNGV